MKLIRWISILVVFLCLYGCFQTRNSTYSKRPDPSPRAMDYLELAQKTENPDQQIRYADLAINSGRLSGENLSFAYIYRGLGWEEKNNMCRAVLDYEQAKRLTPNGEWVTHKLDQYYLDQSLLHHWMAYLKEIQGDADIPNWQSSPFDTLRSQDCGDGPEKEVALRMQHKQQYADYVPAYVNRGTGFPIMGQYQPATRASASGIVQQYGSIPGGVTLEGTAGGLKNIKTLDFDMQSHQFIINRTLRYSCPVTRIELKDIVASLIRDQRLGVSLGSTHVVYGDFRPDSPVLINLKLADRFLGAVVFAETQFMPGYTYADNYLPRSATSKMGAGGCAVYFNFKGFEFTTAKGKLVPAKSGLFISLVPLAKEKSEDGEHLPDYKAIDRSDFSAAYEGNIRHLQSHLDHYLNERIVRIVVAYGEVAAFIRAAEQQGIDLNHLLKNINTEI
jgi:hypothetical protein